MKARCPNCDRTFDSERSPAMPFCSERCRLIDLGEWLKEGRGLPYESEEGDIERLERPSESEDE